MRDLSNLGAFVNLLKGLIGLGVLTLPYATKQVGWLVSSVGMALVAYMTVWGIFFAVLARQRLEKAPESHDLASSAHSTVPYDPEGAGLLRRRTEYASRDVSAPGTDGEGEEACRIGSFEKVVGYALGAPWQMVFVGSIVVAQFGTGVAYVNVVSAGIESHFPSADVRLRVLVSLGLLLTVLSTVRNLKGIAVLSVLGLLSYGFIFLGLTAQARTALETGTWGQSVVMVESREPHVGTWFGISAFSFGTFPIAIVVYDDMRDQGSFFTVTAWSFFCCWLFYTCVALLGYFCYGANVEEIIYLNFPVGTLFREGSLAFVCAGLTLSYVLQMWPVFRYAQQVCTQLHYSLVRGPLVWLSILIAYALPSTVAVIGIIGSVASAVSGFALPPLVFLALLGHWPEPREGFLAAILVTVGALSVIKAL